MLLVIRQEQVLGKAYSEITISPLLDFLSIVLMQRAKEADIQVLQKMRSIRRNVKNDYVVFLSVLGEFKAQMGLMIIDDQKSGLFRNHVVLCFLRGEQFLLGVHIHVHQSLNSQLFVCPALL